MNMKFFSMVILSGLMFFPLNPAQKNRPGLSLEQTFSLYVQAVQNSDLESLFTTITEKEDFFFLTQQGKRIDSREEYYAFHKDWFNEPEWEMPVDNVSVYEGESSGCVTAVFHYKSRLPSGRWYHLDSWFTLIFKKEKGMWKVTADICTPIKRWISETKCGLKYDMQQNFLLSTLKNRRTVRKFTSESVPLDHIWKILDAARFAPTAGNQQPWKFLVIKNPGRLNQLEKEAAEWYMARLEKEKQISGEKKESVRDGIEKTLSNALSAPVYVAVLVDSSCEYPDYAIYDGTLAAGNLMTAARALGYGTGFFTTFFPEDRMKEFFKIPDRYKLICFTPIGVPEKWPDAPPKKGLLDCVVFEKF